VEHKDILSDAGKELERILSLYSDGVCKANKEDIGFDIYNSNGPDYVAFNAILSLIDREVEKAVSKKHSRTEEVIRADERKKCEEELTAKLNELKDWMKD
jgi:glycerol-3-phosphate cytidylyltransferase-like family protein